MNFRPRFLFRFVICLLASFSFGSFVSAQVFELQRQLRDQADALRASQSASAWESWTTLTNWKQAESQLQPGSLLDPGILENVRQKILARVTLDPRSASLAKLLQALAQEASPLTDHQRLDYLEELQSKLVPASPQELQAARVRLKKRLDLLGSQLRAYRDGGQGWKNYLLWKETEQLLTLQEPPLETLTKLECRWAAAPLAWDLPLIRECGDEVRALALLLRRNADTVERLSKALIDAKPVLSQPLTETEILSQLPLLNSLGAIDLGARFTANLRNSEVRPMALINFKPAFFGANSIINDNYTINDARASGTGQIRGTQTTRLIPNSSLARFEATFQGTNTSQTTSSTQGVRINSSVTSQLTGRKEFSFRPTGIVSSPAVATATTNLQFTGIGVGGSRRYQSEARSRVNASRGQAERDAQVAVEQGLRDRLDNEGARTIAKFEEWYKRDILKPLYLQTLFQPQILTKSTNEAAHLRFTLRRPNELLILPSAPELAPTLLQASAHQSFPARIIEMRLSGNVLDQSNWRKVIGKRLADRISTTDDGSEWSIVLPELTPCFFDFSVNNKVSIRVHLKNFKNAEFDHDDINLGFEFESQVVDGKWVLKRQTPPQVQFLADPTTGRIESQLSGRQLSLRSMLRRRIDQLLGQEMILTPQDLGFVQHNGRELAFESILCRDQWLVLNME